LLFNLRKHWSMLRIWTLLQVMAAIPLAVWISVIARQGGRSFGIGWVPESQIQDLIYTLISFSVGYIQPLTLIHWLGLGVFFLLIVIGLRHARMTVEKRSLLFLWAFLPMMLTFLLSLPQPTYVDRFFIVSLPAWLLLVGLGLNRLGGWKTAAACGVVMAIYVVGMGQFSSGPTQQKEAWGEPAGYIGQADEEEAIVGRVLQSIVPLSYYYKGGHPIQAMEINREITSLKTLAKEHTGLWLSY
jgi:hypothetical protein